MQATSVPRAIIFDFNGVIIDDEHLHFCAFQKTLAEEGLELDEPAYYRSYLGLNDRGCFDAALRDRGVEAREPEILARVERKAVHYKAELARHMRLYPGAEDVIRHLAKRVPLAIASGARGDEIEDVLSRARLRDCFRAVVSADDVALGKPNPLVYLEALSSLRRVVPTLRDLEAGDCLVIEDAPNGIRAAHAAGMRCFAIESSVPREELAGAEHVLPALRGLTFERIVELLGPPIGPRR